MTTKTIEPDNFVLSAPHDAVIFLPAVNSAYAKISEYKIDYKRRLPDNFDIRDLAFWTGESKLWNHKFLLHSIGNYNVGDTMKGPLFNRPNNQFTFVGDSGGFQIGKGTLNGIKGFVSGMSANDAVAAWRDNYSAKMWMIDWLNHYTDFAMTIDLPLWASEKAGINSPFHRCSPQQLLDMTIDNLRLIAAESNGRTKWLNVIQGLDENSIKFWWDGVKQYKFNGWAMAGATGYRGGLYNVLYTVLMMRDEGAFEEHCEWVHYLGVSQAKWAVLLTAIQRQLRKHNPKIQLSCDSATAFSSGGGRDEYAVQPILGTRISNWSTKYVTLNSLRAYADPLNNTPSPLSSPIANNLLINHLVVNYDELAGRRIDTLTNMILVNHNVWTILDAGRRAVADAFSADNSNIPAELRRGLDLIEKLFSTDKWRILLIHGKEVLDTIEKNQYTK